MRTLDEYGFSGMGVVNRSYFVGMEKGVGYRMYFTYYSQFGRNDSILSDTEAAIITLLFLIAVFGNSIILVEVIRKCPSKTTEYFIGNLAFSDNLFVLTAPFIAVTRITRTWDFGYFVCHGVMYVLFACGGVSIWTMAIISIDRYLRIVKNRVRPFSPRAVKLVIAVTWFICLLTFLPIAIFFQLRTFRFGHSNVTICTLVWPKERVRISAIFVPYVLMAGFIIPLILMCFNYFCIFRKFWKSRKAVRPSQLRSISGRWAVQRRPGNTLNLVRTRKRQERDFRVVRMLLLLVGLFVVMWSPVFVCLTGVQLDGLSNHMTMHSEYIVAATSIAYMNCCINPVIYGLINRTLVAGMWKYLRCLSLRTQRGHNESVNSISGGPARNNDI
ncbi:free fatty acid receptor 4-like [Liolophura sinensis]|uniref:free fatty acid receptor 4-like n=1 Tax=Liolophura sinensis TaxID=3198878 RepID=UPI003159779A